MALSLSQGIKQVTLLGQNVNSYRELSPSHSSSSPTSLSRGFSSIYKNKEGGRRFAELLHEVAQVRREKIELILLVLFLRLILR